MKLFINDKLVKIVNLNSSTSGNYDVVIKGSEELVSKKLIGNVIVQNAETSQIERLFDLLEVKKLKKLQSISFAVSDKKMIKEFIKDHFKIIKAAGGIVQKDHQILMIYRLKKWDLPKGKLKKGEDPLLGARREVEEECNISVEVGKKLGSTWHSYIRKGKRILKKTDWFLMQCISDENMQPQTEEFIEEVRWMDKKEVKEATNGTYKSIEEIIRQYYKESLIS
jgi:8-oxo-(d)GTP phosphatase